MNNCKAIQCVADFETTSIYNYESEGKVRVWAWHVRRISDDAELGIGNSIETLFEFLSKKNYEIYYHNLKFDGSFLVDYMLRNGWKCVDKKPKANEFSCLCDEMGSWYSITMVFKSYNKRRISTKIFDSLKKLPFSVDKISNDLLGKSVEKLKIDYTKKREENHELTQEEIAYIGNDTLIMSKAMQMTFEKGLKKMTIGSDAFSDFKDEFSDAQFFYYFPKLELEIDDYCRKAYKGGYVYVSPNFAGRDIQNVSSFDVNSLYPSVMYNEFLPYGYPVFYKGKYKENKVWKLYIQHIRCSFKLKENHLPTIQVKHSSRFLECEYLTSSNFEIIDLYLTSIDLKLFFDQYDVFDLEYVDGYMMKGKNGIFTEYIDKWYAQKVNARNESERFFAKLMLNSLYGKFGTRCRRRKITPVIDEKDKLKLIAGEEEISDPKYTPMACFITAYARNKTIRSAQAVYESFIYADTDSIHTTKSVDEISKFIDVDQKELGKWKYEGTCKKAKFLRAKTYIKEFDDGLHVKCAGMPDEVKKNVKWEDFTFGKEFNGKLVAKKVKGGTLLVETTFKIKEMTKNRLTF